MHCVCGTPPPRARTHTHTHAPPSPARSVSLLPRRPLAPPQYNNFAEDPLALKDPIFGAIAARGDLRATTPVPFGGIDAKVAAASAPLFVDAISGPTHDEQPVFDFGAPQWSNVTWSRMCGISTGCHLCRVGGRGGAEMRAALVGARAQRAVVSCDLNECVFTGRQLV